MIRLIRSTTARHRSHRQSSEASSRVPRGVSARATYRGSRGPREARGIRHASRFGRRFLAVCLTFAVAAAPQNGWGDEEKSSLRMLSQAFRDAARRATPSVVTVVVYGQGELDAPQSATPDPSIPDPSIPDPATPDPGETLGLGETLEPPTGLGSGVILREEGVVVTNHHVIAGAKKVVVRLDSGEEIEATRIVSDRASDLAVVRITTDLPLKAAALGDSEALEIGDWVLAIGSPFQLDATVSAGIISAKDRELPGVDRGQLLQTDAAINPGNSGGPLVDLEGNVVGISTAIATRSGGYQGIGFALPIAQASWIADELLQHGKVRRAAIGVRVASVTAKVAAQTELPIGAGALVYTVRKDSPADVAGLQPMDVITHFGQRRVRNPRDLQTAVERQPIGTTQPLTVLRDGEELQMQVVLEAL